MRNNIAIIGMGRFGFSLAKTMAELKNDILIIDKNPENAQKAADFALKAAICDSTKMDSLIDLGMANIDTAIVAIGNDMHATIMTTINLAELGIKNIVVRVDNNEYIPVMKKLGATKVIVPEESSAVSIAHQLSSSSFIDYYNIENEFGIVKVEVKTSLFSKQLSELDTRNKYNVNVIGVTRNGKFFIPKGTDLILKEDQLLIIGKQTDLIKFANTLE